MSKSEKIFKIAWDCDGVLAESHGPVLKEASKRLSEILGKKINITKSDLDTYDALSKKAFLLTKDEKIASEIKQLWHTPALLSLSPPNSAAIEVFNRFQKISDTVQCVVTTRPSHTRQITQEWLERHLPYIDWKQNLHIRQESDTIDGDEFKISHLEQINCMMEDSSATVTQIHTKLPLCHVVYFSQPWNFSDNNPYRSQFRVDFDDTDAIYQSILIAREKYLSG